MKSVDKRFFAILICLIVAMIGLTLLLKSIVPQYITPYWSLIVVFFTIISIVIYFLTKKMKEKNDMHKFTSFYMGVTMAKLMLYLIVIVTYSFVFKEDAKAFIITFLTYYLCFTTAETYILAKK